MYKTAKYKITTKHPMGFRDGEHEVEVTINSDGKSRYVKGGNFGCSRDYFVDGDKKAIINLLSEHMMTLVSLKRIK